MKAWMVLITLAEMDVGRKMFPICRAFVPNQNTETITNVFQSPRELGVVGILWIGICGKRHW